MLRVNIVKTLGFKMYAVLQRVLLVSRTNTAREITFKASQRSKPQKKHVLLTSNVVVLMVAPVTVMNGLYMKALFPCLPSLVIAHGH